MPRGLGLVLGGVIVVGTAATAAYRWWPHPTDESARIRALEARLALLESQRRPGAPLAPQGERHLVVPVAPGTGPAPGEVPTPTPAKAPLLSPGTPVDEAALQREYFGDLDVRLAGEARDPVWAAATEARLRNSVHDLRPRITVENAQCGQTMCRVEAAVPDPADDRAAMDKFVNASLAVLPEVVIRDGEAPGRHIVYFARQGSELPPMSPPETATQ